MFVVEFGCCVKCIRNEILEMNGFNPTGMDNEQCNKLLAYLLTEAETEFEYSAGRQEHPEPLMIKYYYKKNLGKRSSETTSSSTEIAQHADTGCAALLVSALSMGSSASVVDLKMEQSDILREIKAKTIVLKSAKTVLQRFHETGMDLLATIKKMSLKDYLSWHMYVDTHAF